MATTKILLLGIPRSGTTLLTSMIGAHPDAAMLNEDFSYAMDSVIGKKVVGNKLCIPNQIKRSPSLIARVLRRYGIHLFRERSVLSIEEHLHHETLHLLIILRDPRAVIASMMDRGGLSFGEATARWRRGMELAATLWSEERDRTMVVSFEALVQEPEVVVRSICEFLQLRFAPEMLEGWRGHSYVGRGEIQKEKARAGEQADLPGDLQTMYPDAYGEYETLRVECNTETSVGTT